MSLPSGSVPRPLSAGVPKPSLPYGWSCHISKSVPGKCYYFNRFTGAKTWELGELLPGHSDIPAPVYSTEPAYQLDVESGHPGFLQNRPDQVLAGNHGQPRAVPEQRHQQKRQSLNDSLKGNLPTCSATPHQTCGRDDQVASLGVVELEAMLAEQKRKLAEMAGKQLVVDAGQSGSHTSLGSSRRVNRSEDNSSTESGFVSLAGSGVGGEEDSAGGLGLLPGIGNRVRRRVDVRQRELMERGGLYRDWGERVGRELTSSEVEGPTRGSKRTRIVMEDPRDNDLGDRNEDKSRVIQEDMMITTPIDKSKKNVDNRLVGVEMSSMSGKNNDDNNNSVLANKSDMKDNDDDSDSDILSEEGIYGADSEELAALANLDKKFSNKQASCANDEEAMKTIEHSRADHDKEDDRDSAEEIEPTASPHSSSVTYLSQTVKTDSSPPELLLWDNDCQFSPDPASEEEGEECIEDLS